MAAPFLSALRTYARSRARLGAVAAILGASLALSETHPDGRDRPSLLRALEKATELKVESIAFAPSSGVFVDYLFGRRTLFSAHREGQPGDLFRVRVRLLPDGTPIGLGGLTNLSETALSDERALVSNRNFALFATVGADGVESATLLRFSPPGSINGASLFSAVQNLIAGDGLHRVDSVDLLFHEPSPGLTLEIPETKSPHAPITLKVEQGPHSSTFRESELFPSVDDGSLEERPELTLVHRGRDTTPPLHYLVNVAREWAGPGPVAWLESTVFGAQNRVKRAISGPRPGRLAKEKALTEPPVSGTWPPLKVPPLFADAPAGEGDWRPLDSASWSTERAGSPLLTTILHADPERPYSEVRLVAIDTRRLELGLRAGYEEPHPITGPKGSGMLPSAVLPRVIATFNGGFQSAHGAYGMHAEGRLLVPAKDGAATVRIKKNGNVAFGTFMSETELNGDDFRQNLEALLDGGKINPSGRADWGEHVVGGTIATERSALGVTRSGHLLYAWSAEATAETLARAMARAEATYGMHLDMNPGHTGFALHPSAQKGRPSKSSLLDTRMRGSPERYLKWSAQDFFYLASRSALPDRSTFDFRPLDGGKIPRLAAGERTLAHVRLQALRFAPDRVGLSFVPGRFDSRVPGRASELSGSLPSESLFALSAGHATQGSRTGLFFEGNQVIPWKEQYVTLVLGKTRTTLLPPGIRPSESDETSVQFPALVVDGEATAFAAQLGERRAYSALCEEPNGYLLAIRAENDSPLILASAMIDEGCETAALLDRGSHEEAAMWQEAELGKVELTTSWLVGKNVEGSGRASHPATFSHD